MFEVLRIILFGTQPVAKVTDKRLDRIIHRDFEEQAEDVKLKFSQIESDTNKGKNRISAAIIKLANKDLKAIDYYINMSKKDYRDVISQAEYPKCSSLGFNDAKVPNLKRIYLEDWIDYSKWIND